MRSRYTIDRNKTTQFTDAWIVLGVVLTIIGLAARRPALLLIAALLLTIIPVSWLWNHLVLQGVRYRRTFSERRSFVGETIEMTTQVANRKLLPVGWLQIEDQLPLDLPLQDEEIRTDHRPGVGILSSVHSLRWYENVEQTYRLLCTHRGYYSFGPAQLKAGDMFGLFEHRTSMVASDPVIVYPQVLPLEALGLPAKDPLGDRAIRRRLFEDPTRTIGIRDHQPQDGLRHIHWKATARRQELQTRVFEPTSAYNLIAFLNVANFERFWHGYDPVLLEKTIMVAASIANYAAERRYAVGLVANGSLPESDQPIRLMPGRSPAQLTRILELLAAVTPVASVPVEDLLISESAALPWGSTVVLVTGIVTEAIALAVERLRAAGRNMVVISLAQPAPPEMEGVTVYHIPDLREASDDAAELAAGLSQTVEEADASAPIGLGAQGGRT